MPSRPLLIALLAFLAPVSVAGAQGAFVNWETPHVHPLDLTPDGQLLVAVNLPDNRLEIFELATATLVSVGAVSVGLDPVSVRVRTNDEIWVVNQLSDTVSVIDRATRNVKATLYTDDEPADVVFAGAPQRAFVSCSQTNTILVFDPADLSAAPQRIEIEGEEPRALARSSDGLRVYCAIFESGNRTTVLASGGMQPGDDPPDAVGITSGPYGGVNPPPNNGGVFEPALNPSLPTPPEVGLIVRENDAGLWVDDNGTDWSALIDGPSASFSGRTVGWGLADHDVAVIETGALTVSYARHAMNICMSLAVHPSSGAITVVGTDAINEVRFEHNLQGRFLRVNFAAVDPLTLTPTVVELNPQLDYSVPTVAQPTRDLGLSDPRGIVWNADGSRGYVSGLGTNNVLTIDAGGGRLGPPTDVGFGPTGLALDEARGQLYVLHRFENSIAVLDTHGGPGGLPLELARVPFFDPTPPPIRRGRRHLYDARATSGLGVTSCAACHVDARIDRLGWDLGDPAGEVVPIGELNGGAGVPGQTGDQIDFHPMKGPLTTMTLRDIIGKEPFHWRGDMEGIEGFNPGYEKLLGDDEVLDPAEMADLKGFLASIHYPPNPFRNLDGSLPNDLPLNEFSTGRFSPAGTPLPNGDAVNGLHIFRTVRNCAHCHTLPTGMGTNQTWNGMAFQEIPLGPDGEDHHDVLGPVGQIQFNTKIPSLRNVYERTGGNFDSPQSLAGFGFRHDGTVDTLARFMYRSVFHPDDDQEVADLIAFMLTMSSETELSADLDDVDHPPGEAGLYTHPAVGHQLSFDTPIPTPDQLATLATLFQANDAAELGLVVKARYNGELRGGVRGSGGNWRMDRRGEFLTSVALLTMAGPNNVFTVTAVPFGSAVRIGNDRDLDGFYDRDELDAGSDPADPTSKPRVARRRGP